MTALRTAWHRVTGVSITEVWHNGQLIAAIYPTERGLRIISKLLPQQAPPGDRVAGLAVTFPPGV